MHIEALALSQFRNFSSAKLAPGKAINLIVGSNGSGKTSLLESIYCLGFGRSFRVGSYQQLIQHNTKLFTVFARVIEQNGERHQVGYQRDESGEVEIRIDAEKEKRIAALARLVPVQLMTPESIELVLGGPKQRRQFVDWGVFHVEHSFYNDWVKFSKLLKQRNSLLKQKRFHADRAYWDQQFSAYGEGIKRHRDGYLMGFLPVLVERLKAFLPQYAFTFQMRHGWDKELSLADSLEKHLESDMRYGHSTVGPHKAELRIHADGEDVRSLLSRGQTKLLVAALKLVQGEYLQQKTGSKCIYLVDDITAELDASSQAKFCEALVATQSQVFVSAIEVGELAHLLKTADTKMFHVEHGTVTEK